MLDEGSGVGARSGPFDFTFGLKGLVQGLPPLLAGGQAGGRAGRGGDEAAVVRAEAAEARADLAEKYLVGLGTPREVVEVLEVLEEPLGGADRILEERMAALDQVYCCCY